MIAVGLVREDGGDGRRRRLVELSEVGDYWPQGRSSGRVVEGPTDSVGGVRSDAFLTTSSVSSVSHSSHDNAFAVSVADALGSLSSDVECFVSGVSIQAGADWNREIREAPGRSHLLLLLFTSPSQDWDWCLYEAGLYTRFHEEQVSSVVSLFRPTGSGPRPRSNLQCVPSSAERVERWLNALCHEEWKTSDEWLKGPLAPDATPDLISAAAHRIVTAFPGMTSGDEIYHPCQRVVLDLTHASNDGLGIPLDARDDRRPPASRTGRFRRDQRGVRTDLRGSRQIWAVRCRRDRTNARRLLRVERGRLADRQAAALAVPDDVRRRTRAYSAATHRARLTR